MAEDRLPDLKDLRRSDFISDVRVRAGDAIFAGNQSNTERLKRSPTIENLDVIVCAEFQGQGRCRLLHLSETRCLEEALVCERDGRYLR